MSEILDLTIIGGGPAGLTAGLYAARAKLQTRLLEKLSPGGQILNTHWVDNYPGFPEGVSGFELVDRMRSQAERFGLAIESREVTTLERDGDLIAIRTACNETIPTKTLIVATGAQPTKLGVPGELELVGKGVSYCATCDGPFYRDEAVAVVGGGDTAVEEALFLTRFASEVHLFHRRDALRAAGILREKAMAEPKIKIHWRSVVRNILADEKGMVHRIEVRNLESDQTEFYDVTGIFMFVGQNPVTGFLTDFLELDERGFVKTDMELNTSQPGVFAAGDVRVKRLRQVSTAVGDGATAAYMAERYIEEKFGG